jgi:hypothetical protein
LVKYLFIAAMIAFFMFIGYHSKQKNK